MNTIRALFDFDDSSSRSCRGFWTAANDDRPIYEFGAMFLFLFRPGDFDPSRSARLDAD
jgi:hypothetical protein